MPVLTADTQGALRPYVSDACSCFQTVLIER